MSFTNVHDFLEFVKGGRATVTLRSIKTDQHFTYRFKFPRQRNEGEDILFVTYRGGDGRWLYMANLEHGTIKQTRKTNPYMRHHPATLAITWFFEKMEQTGQLPRGVEVAHEGRCGMCGRKLTDPHSLKMGIGPECAKLRLRHPHQLSLPT